MRQPYQRFPKAAINRKAQELTNVLHAHVNETCDRIEDSMKARTRLKHERKFYDRLKTLKDAYELSTKLETLLYDLD
jgi:hypothetical protein